MGCSRVDGCCGGSSGSRLRDRLGCWLLPRLSTRCSCCWSRSCWRVAITWLRLLFRAAGRARVAECTDRIALTIFVSCAAVCGGYRGAAEQLIDAARAVDASQSSRAHARVRSIAPPVGTREAGPRRRDGRPQLHVSGRATGQPPTGAMPGDGCQTKRQRLISLLFGPRCVAFVWGLNMVGSEYHRHRRFQG